jgi:hypothetical protein
MSSDHRLLLQLLHDLYLYLTIRQSLINIHLTFHLYSPLHTLESHLKYLHLTLTATTTHPSTQAAQSLFHTLQLEIICLINIFDCRFHVLKGKDVGLVLSCDQLRDHLISWAELIQQQLPIRLKSPEEMGYWGGGTGTDVDHVTTPFWDWDSLLGWMCACYRRFLAISQLLFQDKRKHVHELFVTESDISLHVPHPPHAPPHPLPSTSTLPLPPPPPSSSLPSHYSSSTGQQEILTPITLSPRASFISKFRSSAFSSSQQQQQQQHACVHCQAYQHCICPNSDHRCLNHDMTSLVAAIDQFFIHGKVYFQELSLAFVCLTSDGELATAQYLCPPRDQWEVINHHASSQQQGQLQGQLRIFCQGVELDQQKVLSLSLGI